MKNINSSRIFECLWFDGGEAIEIETTIDRIFAKGDNESDYEYNYAMQDDIDSILDMKVGETKYFQFNRDDESTKGVILRKR